MRDIWKIVIPSAFLVIGLSACGEQSSPPKAPESSAPAMEAPAAGGMMDDAGNAMDGMMDDAGDAMEGMMDDAGDAMDGMMDDADDAMEGMDNPLE